MINKGELLLVPMNTHRVTYDWDASSVPAGFCAACVLTLIAWTLPCGAQPATTNANLLPNPSFEQPAGVEGVIPLNWDCYATKNKIGGLCLKEARTGRQSCRLRCQGVKDGAEGVVRRLPVNEDAKYTFSAHLKRDPDEPLAGMAVCQLVVEWVNEANREIGRDLSQPVRSVPRLRWERTNLRRVKAPKGAVQAVFGIHLYEGKNPGKGAVLVDDVELVRD